MSLPKPLRGIVPPMITPLKDADTLDTEGVERLVNHLIEGGVSGIFALGTTGEGPSLSHGLQQEVVTATVQAAKGRVPVLIGITDASYVESIALAQHAADAGADAVVFAPPFYYGIDQDELLLYTRKVVQASPLPVFLYNMPSTTKLVFEPETVEALLDEENIAGLKDSSGDLEYFKTVQPITAKREDWALLMGPEELLVDAVELGGQGGVAGGSNQYPKLFVEWYKAAVAGDKARVEALRECVSELGKLYLYPISPGSVTRGNKYGLSRQGICDPTVAPPFRPMNKDEIAIADGILDTLNGMLEKHL